MTDSSMRMTWQLPDSTEYMIDSNLNSMNVGDESDHKGQPYKDKQNDFKRKLFTEGSTQLKVLSK